MPRKPKKDKRKITVVANGKTITVTMYPPHGRDKSWYAYWNGLPTKRSTKCRNFDQAVQVVHDTLRNGCTILANDAVLSDQEFDEIQRRHFGKKKDPIAQERAKKSLKACMEAITAFRQVIGIAPIVRAKAADCEQFQQLACELPKNWRSKYPNSREKADKLSPNTVLKWSGALQAAWERANRNAGRTCVRGVVQDDKLLTQNPWREFTWIEGKEKEIRQFDDSELISFLDFLEEKWPNVTIAKLVAKTCLWSASRKSEVMELKWDSLRKIGDELHFDTIGKWNVRKWFRIPKGLYEELESVRIDNPYVFAAYNDQLRAHHSKSERPWLARKVLAKFKPSCLGDWFYERVKDWSETIPNGSACIHVFRKTTLKYARAGEDANRRVASDARVSEHVMMTHYVTEGDPELREKSNRTFERIRLSLLPTVAVAYGDDRILPDPLLEQLKTAEAEQDWATVAKIAQELQRRNGKAG